MERLDPQEEIIEHALFWLEAIDTPADLQRFWDMFGVYKMSSIPSIERSYPDSGQTRA